MDTVLSNVGTKIPLINPDIFFLKQSIIPILLIVICVIIDRFRCSKLRKLKIRTSIIPIIFLIVLAASTIIYNYWWSGKYLNITTCCSVDGTDSRKVYRENKERGYLTDPGCDCGGTSQTAPVLNFFPIFIAIILIAEDLIGIYKIGKLSKRKKTSHK